MKCICLYYYSLVCTCSGRIYLLAKPIHCVYVPFLHRMDTPIPLSESRIDVGNPPLEFNSVITGDVSSQPSSLFNPRGARTDLLTLLRHICTRTSSHFCRFFVNPHVNLHNSILITTYQDVRQCRGDCHCSSRPFAGELGTREARRKLLTTRPAREQIFKLSYRLPSATPLLARPARRHTCYLAQSQSFENVSTAVYDKQSIASNLVADVEGRLGTSRHRNRRAHVVTRQR